MKLEAAAPMMPFNPQLIDPSPYQARTRFEGIEELAESIKEHGLIQPLIARPSPADGGRLELIAGERRLRACKLAGLEQVNVIVHENVPDHVAEELVLIENLQREDLTPMEEAEGYFRLKALRDAESGRSLYTNETICERLKVTLSRVEAMLHMRECGEDLRAAVNNREVAVSVAALVGRIPDPKARAECGKEVLRPKHQDTPLSFQQTKELIREKYMVKVAKGCGFDPKDPMLLPAEANDAGVRMAGGSCEDCPWRTGNRADLDGEVKQSGGRVKGKAGGSVEGVDPWMCTMPACFRRKQANAWSLVRRQAEEQGLKIIEGDAARKMFDWQGDLNYDSPWAELDSKPQYRDFGNASHGMPTWRKLISGLKVEMAVVQHPQTGKAVYLCKREPVVEAVKKAALEAEPAPEKGKANGKPAAKAGAAATDAPSVPAAVAAVAGKVADQIKAAALQEQQAKEARKDEREKAKLDQAVMHEGLNRLLTAVKKDGVDVERMPMMAELVLHHIGSDGLHVIGKWLGLTPDKNHGGSGWAYEKPILAHLKANAGGKAGWDAFLFVFLIAGGMRYSGPNDDEFQAALKEYGVDKKEIQKQAKDELKQGKKKPAGKAAEKAPAKDEGLCEVKTVEDFVVSVGSLGDKVPKAAKRESQTLDKCFQVALTQGKMTVTVGLTICDGEWAAGYKFDSGGKAGNVSRGAVFAGDESPEEAVLRVLSAFQHPKEPLGRLIREIVDGLRDELGGAVYVDTIPWLVEELADLEVPGVPENGEELPEQGCAAIQYDNPNGKESVRLWLGCQKGGLYSCGYQIEAGDHIYVGPAKLGWADETPRKAVEAVLGYFTTGAVGALCKKVMDAVAKQNWGQEAPAADAGAEPDPDKTPSLRDQMLTLRSDDEAGDGVGRTEMSFEDQVAAALAGTSYPDILGPRPAEGTPERKAWEARKVKIWRAVEKAKKANA